LILLRYIDSRCRQRLTSNLSRNSRRPALSPVK
jgi:hypothetical protein